MVLGLAVFAENKKENMKVGGKHSSQRTAQLIQNEALKSFAAANIKLMIRGTSIWDPGRWEQVHLKTSFFQGNILRN